MNICFLRFCWARFLLKFNTRRLNSCMLSSHIYLAHFKLIGCNARSPSRLTSPGLFLLFRLRSHMFVGNHLALLSAELMDYRTLGTSEDQR